MNGLPGVMDLDIVPFDNLIAISDPLIGLLFLFFQGMQSIFCLLDFHVDFY